MAEARISGPGSVRSIVIVHECRPQGVPTDLRERNPRRAGCPRRRRWPTDRPKSQDRHPWDSNSAASGLLSPRLRRRRTRPAQPSYAEQADLARSDLARAEADYLSPGLPSLLWVILLHPVGSTWTLLGQAAPTPHLNTFRWCDRETIWLWAGNKVGVSTTGDRRWLEQRTVVTRMVFTPRLPLPSRSRSDRSSEPGRWRPARWLFLISLHFPIHLFGRSDLILLRGN